MEENGSQKNVYKNTSSTYIEQSQGNGASYNEDMIVKTDSAHQECNFPVKVDREEKLEDKLNNSVKLEIEEHDLDQPHLPPDLKEEQSYTIKTTSYECRKCGLSVTSEKRLLIHLLTGHYKERPYQCPLCNYKNVQKGHIRNHIYQSKQAEPYKCLSCDYTTIEEVNLQRHIRIKHCDERFYLCSVCDYRSTSKLLFERHINSEHTKETLYPCPLCEYESLESENLRTHIKLKHSLGRPFMCSHCDYRSVREKDLQIHITSQHTKKILYQCHSCDYIAVVKRYLQRHIRNEHMLAGLFRCSFCDYRTLVEELLQKHIGSKHPGERPC